MATGESSGVAAAFRGINGLVAEAYSFVELVDAQVSEPSGLELLLTACLRRLADAYDQYEHQLRRAGVDVDGSRSASVDLGGRSEAEGGGEAPLQSGSPN